MRAPQPRPELFVGRAVAVFALGMTATGAPGQGIWEGSGSPALYNASYCYDPVRDRMVLFGSGNNPLRATFECDPTQNPFDAWRLISPTAPERTGSSLVHGSNGGVAYDPVRQRVVCYDSGAPPPDYRRTWTWDGASWTLTQTGSTLWFEHVIGHSGRGQVMAFGGANVYTGGVDLYDWTGTTWVMIPQAVRPPRPFNSSFPQSVRVYSSAAYDARRDRMVLFGSADVILEEGNGYRNALPTIWEWDGAQGWVNRSVAFPTTFYPWVQMVFDASRGTLVAFMNTPVATARVRTFEWDGGTAWRELFAPPPSPVWSFAALTVGHDSMRGHSYTLFRDLGPNFYRCRFATVLSARFEQHGGGCSGSLGQPQLSLVHPWTRAWIGSTLEMQLSNLPQSAGLMIMGWSDQRSGVLTLPASLASFGMPGCFARVSFDSVFHVSGTANQASLRIPIPADIDMLGFPLFAQGCSLDPGFNSLGLTVTNSVRLTAGIR